VLKWAMHCSHLTADAGKKIKQQDIKDYGYSARQCKTRVEA